MRASKHTDSTRPHILVVDDEPQIRELLQAVLEREGYRVTVRGEAAHALEDIRESDIAVLITDLKMPRMNGLELLQAAKQIRPDLGSILVTGYASTETAVKALRYGADDFITKPVALEDLRRVVDRVLSSRRMLCGERDALDLAREEAASLRERHREATAALAEAQRELTTSECSLARRIRDLEFIGDLTKLLAKEDDLQRILERTVRILTARFQAAVTRIEVALTSDVHTAQHVEDGVSARMLTALGTDLVDRARDQDQGVLRKVVLGFDRPLEALAAPLDLSIGPAGGLSVLRDVSPGEDPGDLFLFSMVPRALAVAVETQLQREAAVRGALRVAMGMLDALEGRGALHRGHADRVARLSRTLARELGLSVRLQEVIRTAAKLHDVGEVGIPDGLLQRAGPLSDSEREVVRQHPVLGARILAPFGEAAAFVRHHKERPDGQGYPDGLREEEIPIGAAIIGVAEAYDAITHHRAYRPSRPRHQALEEVERLSGIQFVPRVVEALLLLPRERI